MVSALPQLREQAAQVSEVDGHQETVMLDITQADIDGATRKSFHRSPVHVAAARLGKTVTIFGVYSHDDPPGRPVWWIGINSETELQPLPYTQSQWIRAWYLDQPVQPIRLDPDAPDTGAPDTEPQQQQADLIDIGQHHVDILCGRPEWPKQPVQHSQEAKSGRPNRKKHKAVRYGRGAKPR